MPRRVNKHKHFLQLLRSTEKNQQKAILKTASEEQLKTLSEIILNLLAGNIPINFKTKRSLKKYKDNLRGVTEKKVAISTLRRRWNKFPLDVLQNIIKITLTYLDEHETCGKNAVNTRR